MADQEWEKRVAEAWASFGSRDEEDNLALIDRLAAELPAGDPSGLYERASVRDAIGLEGEAVSLYQRALDAGLPEGKRRRAVIQLASSLRNIGAASEAADLLTAELDAASD